MKSFKRTVQFYVNAACYLKDNFPFDKPIFEYALYLHVEKRNSISSTSGISNIALHITKALENVLEGVFQVSCATSKEQVCDIIRKEWLSYQLEDISGSLYTINSSQPTQLLQPISSDWSYIQNDTTQLGGSKSRNFLRIDQYWSKIGKICDDAGQYKFKHLASLANCALSLSHGNAAPERGFSLNKKLLDIHGTSIQDETITVLRIGLLR